MADSLILMVLALVVFGPRRLPQIGRQIGKLMYEFRKASNDFKFQMEEELRSAEDADRRKKDEERLRALALAAPAQPAVAIEASVPAVPATAESPYPEEVVYPSAIAPTAEAAVEETYPRIQQPSTGEQVQAARPTSLAAQAQTQAADERGSATDVEARFDTNSGANAAVAEEAPVVAEEAPVEQTSAVTEQAAQNG